MLLTNLKFFENFDYVLYRCTLKTKLLASLCQCVQSTTEERESNSVTDDETAVS